MGQRFRGQVVVVTGASSGIGRATAETFAREGARVVVAARRKDDLERAAAVMRRGGKEARAIPCNVTVPAQLKRVMEAAVERWERLDVVVANAGIGLAGDLMTNSRDDIRYLFDVNVMGVIQTIQAALPHMVSRGQGTIVIVSSVLGYRGVPGYAVYCASKFALNGLSEALRTELAPLGIHVVLACPGLTDTEFAQRRLGIPRRDPIAGRVRPTPAGVVAARIVDAVARRRNRIVISPGGRALALLGRHAPRLADWAVARWYRSTPVAPAEPETPVAAAE